MYVLLLIFIFIMSFLFEIWIIIFVVIVYFDLSNNIIKFREKNCVLQFYTLFERVERKFPMENTPI